jgi:hypothetical protein
MYTANKDGQKDARISLSYNPKTKKFENPETFAIYGSHRTNRNILESFVDGNNQFAMVDPKAYTERDIKHAIPIWGQLERLHDTLNASELDYADFAEGGDWDHANETYSKVSEGYKL